MIVDNNNYMTLWFDPPDDYNYEKDAEFIKALENDELWASKELEPEHINF